MDKNKVEDSLVETLRTSELGSLSAEYAEFGLDQMLDDSLLRDIPVVSTLRGIVKVGVTIHGNLFTKKLIRFLSGLSDVPPEQRQSQIDKLDNDAGERKRVGETILILLDKANDMNKPAMMAKAFRAYLLAEISYLDLRQLWHAIDVLDVSYLPELKHVYESGGYSQQDGTDVLPPSPEYHHLAICGLLMFEFGGMGAPSDSTPRKNPDGSVTTTIATAQKGGFKKNSLGHLFVKTICYSPSQVKQDNDIK